MKSPHRVNTNPVDLSLLIFKVLAAKKERKCWKNNKTGQTMMIGEVNKNRDYFIRCVPPL